MASRHDIIHIDFRANAGRANKAVESIRKSAKDSRDAIVEMQKALNEGIAAGNGQDWIDKQTKKIRDAKKELKAFEKAERELVKGVDVLSRGIDAFNNGSLDKMSAAMQKAIGNAARLARSKMTPDTAQSKKDIAEMDAIIMATDKNLVKSRQDFAELANAIKTGGKTSTAELSLAREQLKELMSLTAKGTKEWQDYQNQLTVVADKLRLLSIEDIRTSGKQNLGRAFRGDFATADVKTLNEVIAKLREYQSVIDDPKGKGARHFAATTQQIQALTAQLDNLKEHAITVEQAMKMANATNTEQAAIWAQNAKAAKEEAQAQREMLEDKVKLARQDVERTKQQVEGSQQRISSAKQELAVVEEEILKNKELEEAIVKGKSVRMDWANAQDNVVMARNATINERGEWLKRNDEVIKAQVRVDELNEDLNKTSNLKEQQKIIQEIKVAEEELTKAKAKADEQNKKYEQSVAKLRAEEEKEKTIKESLIKLVGGRDYDEERDRIDNLKEKRLDLTEAIEKEENEHKQLSQSLQEEKRSYEQLNQAAAEARSKEQKAAVEMAQAQNQSQEVYEQALSTLEKVHKKTNDGTDEYKQQSEAIEKLKQRLLEMKGEWMSVADAEKIASTAGTDGFFATQKQMTQAVQAIERQRDALIKTIQQKQEDGQATAAEEAELKRLEKVLKDLKFEQDNFNMSHKQMNDILKQPKSAEDLDQLKAAIKRADGELRRMKQSLGENNKQYQDFANEVKEAKMVLKEMEGQAKATSSAFDKAWSSLKTYVGLYVGAAVAMQKATQTFGDILELSDKMGEVRKTTGFTADEVGRLATELKKLDTRTSLTSLMELSSIAGSLGLKTQEQIQGFTEAANMLTVALPEMGNEASRSLMKIADATGDLRKNGGDVRETLEKVGSTIIALRANSAAAAGPITDFVSRVGAVGAQAGISIDQIAALGATVDALGGRVEMSATALSRMIPAIKNNSFAVASAIGITERELKKMTGMEQMVTVFRRLHDSIQQFDTSTDEGMNAMADKVEQMLGNSASMQEVMKTLNQQGARAGIVFGLLSQNVDKLEEQLKIASNAYSENTALLYEYNNMNDTAAGKWERLKNQMEEFFVGAGSTNWLSNIIDVLRILADWVTDEGPLGRLTRYTIAYMAMMKTGWTQSIGNAVLAVYEFIFATNKSAAATVADTAATTADTGAKVANAAATEGAAAAQGKLNKTMKANLITAVLTAIVALGWAIYDYAKKAKDAARQTDMLADVEKKAKEESVKQRAELEKLYKATQDQTKSIEERKEALRKMVGDAKYKEYYKNLNTESGLAKAAAEAYKDLAAQIIATARARALDAKAEKLQQQRIGLEDQKTEREEWRKKNQGHYKSEKQSYSRQQQYVSSATGGWTAGFQESQIAQRGSSAMKPVIIEQFESNEKEIGRIDSEIGQIDKDLEKLKDHVTKINPSISDGGGSGGGGNGGSVGSGVGNGGTNPYGTFDKVTSDYSKWSGDKLVARRKEMLERVKALANGADVQDVLSEDEKFISDAVRKNIKTTEQAIEWYNQERLKIQDALHAKHLTNTGDWLDEKDPKKRKRRAKQYSRMVQDDMKYYLDELDAYYTERNQEIQKKRNEEEITEGEAWLQTIKNETEWYQRRAELQKLYADKSKEVAQEEQDAIFDIISERTGDTTKFIRADIAQTVKFIEAVGQKSKPAMDRIKGDLDLGIEKDTLKSAKSVGKSVKFMADTLAKERPLDGIVENLQLTLTKMGILEGQVPEKMRVLLGEIETAYSSTIEDVLRRMGEAGMTAWAEEIRKSPDMQNALMAQLQKAYDAVQNAIRKEAEQIKRQTDIWWADVEKGQTQSRKGGFEAMLSRLGLAEDQVKRANSLINAGHASQRVADKLAIKQMQVQLQMQQTYYLRMRQIGEERIRQLEAQGKLEDAEHLRRSLNLALTKEQSELDKQRVAIANQLEESQNRLYTELKEWGDLLAQSLQSMFEASNAGNAEYYNERAKLNLTGKGGPGAGRYVVIDKAGTSRARAHYEYLDERQALERQHEIEQENAIAEAWKKVMDDLNKKMSDMITDRLNALLQNAVIEANTTAVSLETEALRLNTEATNGLSNQLAQGITVNNSSNTEGGGTPGVGDFAADKAANYSSDNMSTPATEAAKAEQDASNNATRTIVENNKKAEKSTKSSFAAMTAAANMYGIAYQAMSNENLSTAQKVEMMIVQAAGQALISMLTASLAADTAETASHAPSWVSKTLASLGPIGGPVAVGVFTALIGGLMGLAVSKITKSKSQIAQATGASGASAGKLTTGMLTYAEGNVNEFTDPASLTPGRKYNVDAADGRTYRARYMGANPKTHITSGPEFHLSGERGREMIIDAGTTRQITMNESDIWHAIQTLSGGGSLRRSSSLRRRGIAAHADGNVDEFDGMEETGNGQSSMVNGSGITPEQMAAFQSSLDRNNELLERALTEGIKAVNKWNGPDGIPNMVNQYNKKANRHGEKYL